MMIFSAVGGAIALTLALLLMWERPRTLRTQAVLMVIAGAGIAGLAHRLLTQLSAAASHLLGGWTNSLLGASVPWIVALAALALFALHMDPKRGHPRRWTPWLGLMVPMAWLMIPWSLLLSQAGAGA